MKMSIPSLLAGACIALAALPAFAESPNVYVQVAPPAPRVERIPVQRHGHVWVPGHWQWNGRAYVWINGHWMAERRGWVYQEARWVQYGGRWGYHPGGWVRVSAPPPPPPHHYPHGGSRHRDSDHDGVPDRYDRAPNNPYRR